MATNYPGSLDSFTNPGPGDEMDDAGVEHDVQHSDANDAIEAVQAKLGTGASDASGAGVLDVLAADGAGGTTWQSLSHGALSDLGDVSDHPDYATLDGSRAFTGSVEIPDGALSELSLRFVGNTNTGIFLENGTDLAVMADGVVQFRVESDRVSSEVTFDIVESGSAASPALDFFNGNTGFFIPGFDMGVTVQGVEMARFVDGVGFQISVDGSAAAPSLAFTSDPDTGFYHHDANADEFAVATGGSRRARFSNSDVTLFTSAGNTGLRVSDNVEVLEVLEAVGGGSAATPNIVFASGADDGIYTQNFSHLGIAWSGADSATFNGDGMKVVDGSTSAPSLSFINDPDTGLHGGSGDFLYFVTGGVDRWMINVNGDLVDSGGSRIFVGDGTAGAPGYTFSNDSDNGMYIGSTADSLAFSAGGGRAAQFGTDYVFFEHQLRAREGTAAAPTYSFNGDQDTGMYRGVTAVGDAVLFSTEGQSRMVIDSGGLLVQYGTIRAPFGSPSAPGFEFSNDPGTGMCYVNDTGGPGVELVENGATVATFRRESGHAQIHVGGEFNDWISYDPVTEDFYDFVTGSAVSSSNIRAGDFTNASDRSFKQNLRPNREVRSGSLLDALRGVQHYRYEVEVEGNDSRPTRARQRAGLVAQEVQQAMGEDWPGVTTVDSDGTLGLSIPAMIGMLVEAVNEVTERLEALETNA